MNGKPKNCHFSVNLYVTISNIFFIIIYYKLFENIKLRGRKRRKETTIAISTAYVYILCLMKYGELIFPYKHNLIVISSYYNFYKKKRGGLSFNKL